TNPLRMRLKCLDRSVDPETHTQTRTTHVANYYLLSGKLIRQTCVTGSPNDTVTLGKGMLSVNPSCSPTSCPALPDTVSLTITETSVPPGSGPTVYKYILTANVRPEAQSFTPP